MNLCRTKSRPAPGLVIRHEAGTPSSERYLQMPSKRLALAFPQTRVKIPPACEYSKKPKEALLTYTHSSSNNRISSSPRPNNRVESPARTGLLASTTPVLTAAVHGATHGRALGGSLPFGTISILRAREPMAAWRIVGGSWECVAGRTIALPHGERCGEHQTQLLKSLWFLLEQNQSITTPRFSTPLGLHKKGLHVLNARQPLIKRSY